MYIIADKFIIRTPRNSFNLVKTYFNKSVEVLFSQPNIQESIRIASLDLYNKLKKRFILENKEKERAKNSLIRYMNRMSTRCTPFGLFAGCSLGKIDKYTHLTLSSKIVRHTRLDMNYLCSLSQYLAEIPEIKYKLKYYPNSSLYALGNVYRYIEYQYVKDVRIHQVSSVKRTFYLNKIIQFSYKGISIEDLYPCITNEYIQKENSINYIDSLIKSQILVPEIDLSVTGNDFLAQIISILDKRCVDCKYSDMLKHIQSILKEIDTSQIFLLSKYEEIENIVKKNGAPYNKYLLQVDMNNAFINSTMGVSIKKEILSSVIFLNKIKSFHKKSNLLKFQEEFIKRFEGREIPLSIALDPEIGIGYPVESSWKDISSLLNGFNLPLNKEALKNVNYGAIESILLKKITAQNNSSMEIELKDEDFKDAKENWDDLPDTFSVLLEIIKDDKKDTLIRLKSIGGSSAANLVARFAYTDKKIDRFISEIVRKEESLHPKSILAEIVHLPDSRVGNVLYRPHLRNYEIVYLANSTMPKDKIIYASDIMLSINKGKLFLRSKQLNKEIIPYLTNAHNYSLSTIPIYRFLCDLQCQNKRTSLSFDMGFLYDELPYIPRIRYKNTILSLATWNVQTEGINHLVSIKNDKDLLSEANSWRVENKIPNCCLLSDFDNDLFVDWSDISCLRSFLSLVKNRKYFRLTEFIYNENDAVVRDESGNGYLNECVLTLIKTNDK